MNQTNQTNQMTNEETDTALILENELKRRVTEVLGGIVHKVVSKALEAHFAEHKANMMLEISVAVGKMLRGIEEEGRKPLWETDPAEFRTLEIKQRMRHAVRKQA